MNTTDYAQKLEEDIYKKAVDTITSWQKDDIYVVSFFFWDEEQNPCMPRLTIGYNTEERYQSVLLVNGFDRQDARWNYAWWLQEDTFPEYGSDPESGELIRQWVKSYGVEYFEEWSDPPVGGRNWEQYEIIEKVFLEILVRVVQALHKNGVLQAHFGKEIPIIIHELDYYDMILDINLLANGKELIEKGFIDLCKGR